MFLLQIILKSIYSAHLRLSKFLVGLGIIGLGSLTVAAQVDTVSTTSTDSNIFRGTIKVARPGIKPLVEVHLEYRLYKGKLTDGRDPKKLPKAPKGVSFVGDKTNVIANGAEYPQPSTIDLPGRDKYFISGLGDTDSPIDGFISFDYNSFFTDNLGYTYPYANFKKVDSVQIVISISKDGTFTFDYLKEKKKRSIVEEKGFESVGHIKTWNPAKLLIYKGDGSRLVRKKRTNCIVYMTLIITAQPGAPEFDALWEEAGK